MSIGLSTSPQPVLRDAALKPGRWWRKTSLRNDRVILLSACLALAVVALIAALVVGIRLEGGRTLEFRSSMDRSLQTRSTTWTILSLVQDAQTGVLAFTLTGDSSFSQVFEESARALPVMLGRLRQLAEETVHAESAEKLEALVLGDLERYRRAIVEAGEDGTPTPLVPVEDLRDGLLPNVRTLVNEIITTETLNIERHSADERDKSAAFSQQAQLLLALIVVLLLTAGIGANAYIRQRRRSEAELRTARQAAEESLKEAEHASRAKTDFLASMSHEIRTPLNGIIGYSELLFDTALKPEQRRYLERIRFAGSALLLTVNDILDFSKIEAGRMQLRPAPFSITALVNNAVSIVAEQAERKGLELKAEIDPELPKAVLGDEARIAQILLNLLNNACKFTESGRVLLQVGKASPERSQDIRFAVSDTGIGIPAAKLPHLFERFYQVDQGPALQVGGTGLGLAISKRLVELMEGQIGVQSQLGTGSEFWFTVPLKPVSGAELRLLHATEPSGPLQTATGHILLVEDLEHNRDLVQMILTEAGHVVSTAENGAQALEMVKACSYDLILMDIQMPIMDGITATRKIRQMDLPIRDVPIIAVTANVLPHQVKLFAEAGMNGFASKPFRRAELLEKVGLCLRRERSRQEAQVPEEEHSLDELRDVMGEQWLVKFVAELQRRIDATFARPALKLEDRSAAAREAHSLISMAGVLGFSELALNCQKLESSCASGEDVDEAFQEARAVAMSVRSKLKSRWTNA